MSEFRAYPDHARPNGVAINLGSGRPKKTDYSNLEGEHPDDPLNNEYVARAGMIDIDRPLCFALHDGVVCQRPVRRGSEYCYLGK